MVFIRRLFLISLLTWIGQTSLFSQNTVYLTYGIPAGAYSWNGTQLLTDFFGGHYGGNVLLVIGTNDTSLFTIACETVSDAKGNTRSKLIQVGKKGSYTEWEIFYEDEPAIDDRQQSEFKYAAKKKLGEYVKKLQLDQLEKANLWISGDGSYVAKLNSFKMNTCFTWNLSIDDDEHAWSFEWYVETGPYETHRDISYAGVIFDVDLPCYYGIGKDSVMQIISKSDTFLVRKNKPYTEYVPREWIPDWHLRIYEDSAEIEDLKQKLLHINDDLKKKYPLLHTHVPELIENNDGYSVMLLLKPKEGNKGRVYSWYGVAPFHNGGTEFFILFIKSGVADAASQKRIIELFKKIKGG